MSEHDDRYGSSDLPRTTAEFRATPDASASTAEFRAFVAKQDGDDKSGGRPGGAWPKQPWAGEAASGNPRRTIAVIAGIAALIIIIAIIIAVG